MLKVKGVFTLVAEISLDALSVGSRVGCPVLGSETPSS